GNVLRGRDESGRGRWDDTSSKPAVVGRASEFPCRGSVTKSGRPRGDRGRAGRRRGADEAGAGPAGRRGCGRPEWSHCFGILPPGTPGVGFAFGSAISFSSFNPRPRRFLVVAGGPSSFAHPTTRASPTTSISTRRMSAVLGRGSVQGRDLAAGPGAVRGHDRRRGAVRDEPDRPV